MNPSISEKRENVLETFLKNIKEHIDKGEVTVTIKLKEKTNPLRLINPDMLKWAKFVENDLFDWLYFKQHKIGRFFGNWKNEKTGDRLRWAEIFIGNRKCVLDFYAKEDDTGRVWPKNNKILFEIYVDPYFFDTTDNNWSDLNWTNHFDC
jgi:hypothetical protein